MHCPLQHHPLHPSHAASFHSPRDTTTHEPLPLCQCVAPDAAVSPNNIGEGISYGEEEMTSVGSVPCNYPPTAASTRFQELRT